MNEDNEPVSDHQTYGQVAALSIVTALLIAELPNARAFMAAASEQIDPVIEAMERGGATHLEVSKGMRDLWRNLSGLVHDELRARAAASGSGPG